jgi:hypothetical protein
MPQKNRKKTCIFCRECNPADGGETAAYDLPHSKSGEDFLSAAFKY